MKSKEARARRFANVKNKKKLGDCNNGQHCTDCGNWEEKLYEGECRWCKLIYHS